MSDRRAPAAGDGGRGVSSETKEPPSYHKRRTAQAPSPFERRAAEIWDNSVRPLFEAALDAHQDDRAVVRRHTRVNFVKELARAFEHLSRLVIVTTFDRSPAAASMARVRTAAEALAQQKRDHSGGPMRATALALAGKGLAVLPCWPRSKVPATAHGLKDATTASGRRSHMTALQAALQYAGRGWSVLPCRDKVPLVRGGVHAATRDLATIERWWHTWPQANVAIACGTPSGVVVIDIDSPAEVTELFNLTTLCASTPSGGRHFYCRYGEGIRNQVLDWGEVRSTGLYVVIPKNLV